MANINVHCPHCQTVLETPDSFAGSEVQCPTCGKGFVVNAAPPAVNAVPAAAPQMAPLPVRPNIPSLPKQAGGGSPILIYCFAGVTLLVAIVSLILALTSSGLPKVKLETDPKKAVKAHLAWEAEMSSIRSYFWRKNGDKILKSLDIKEVKTNGNFAVVFYKLSLGATEVKRAMMLYKVNDGYWIECDKYEAGKKCPEKWLDEMEEKIKQFTKDSGKFDDMDI